MPAPRIAPRGRALRIADVLLLGLIGLLPVFGMSLDAALFALIVLPVLARPRQAAAALDRRDWLFLALAGQYLLFHLLRTALNGGLIARPELPAPAESEIWIVSLILLVAALMRFRAMPGLRDFARHRLPLLLIGCFAVLTVDYLFSLSSDSCRIRALTRITFMPAYAFAALAFVSCADWEEFSGRERGMRYVLLALSVVVTAAFAGARALLIAEFVIVALLCPRAVSSPGHKGILPALPLAGAFTLGCLIALLFSFLAGCDLHERLLRLLLAAQQGPEVDRSLSYRAQAYGTAFEAIRQRPIFGHGIAREASIAAPLAHVHSIYLSWMIWGGVVSLASGILFLVSPAFLLARRAAGMGAASVAAATIGLAMLWQVVSSAHTGRAFLALHIVIAVVGVALWRCRAPARQPVSDSTAAPIQSEVS